MHQTKERLLHHVIITVFCKPHDNRETIIAGLDRFSPTPCGVLLQQEPDHDPERPHTTHYCLQDTTLTVQDTMTDAGKMSIFTLQFKKMSAVNAFIKQVVAAMTADELAEFREEPELLLDEEGRISLRLDKELLQAGKLSLTDDGNCYQTKSSVAAYPKNEERIREALGHILS